MNALIWKEARYCDDTFLFLNAIVDLSDVVCMGYPALCDQDFLQLLRVLVNVQQNPSDRWTVALTLRSVSDRQLDIIQVYHSLEEMADSLCEFYWFSYHWYI